MGADWALARSTHGPAARAAAPDAVVSRERRVSSVMTKPPGMESDKPTLNGLTNKPSAPSLGSRAEPPEDAWAARRAGHRWATGVRARVGAAGRRRGGGGARRRGR